MRYVDRIWGALVRIADVLSVLHEDGPRWLTWRLWYELQLRSGFARRLPPISDVSLPLSLAARIPVSELDGWLYSAWQQQGGTFVTGGGTLEGLTNFVANRDDATRLAERTLTGQFRYFSSGWRTLGLPPDWFQGLSADSHWPSDVHWSRLPDLSPELGDIKYVWEPSRFGFVYGLVRAWAVTHDERYPEAFWLLTEHWLSANQPELGPHWRCAQEMSLRCMAWAFGLYVFRECASTTPERVTRLIKHLWYHASHVEQVHWYATECVRNNHAISEAAGLFTVGTLFPFLPKAALWQRMGTESLARELQWQVYQDGTYVQHSMNYARFVVQICTWVLRLAELNTVALPEEVRASAKRLLRFLVAVQDPVSGRVPNYGSNDGALILPLSSCSYFDYRPALGALSVALGEGRLYSPGPWDEEAAWLCGPERVRAASPSSISEVVRVSTEFPEGGYYTLRGRDTYGMIRCGTYRHRPAQADMLHLDISYSGHNVLIDPGTHSYNAPSPWPGHFAGTAAHNTVLVDGRDQMRKGSRFMWHNWTKSRLLQFGESEGRCTFTGEHSAYAPVTHRRTVVLAEDTYIVLDELSGGEGQHDYRLHWLLNDFPTDLREDGAVLHLPGCGPLQLAVVLQAGEKVNGARGQDIPAPRGWQSVHYGEKSPAWSLELMRTGTTASFITVIGPQERVDTLLGLGREGILSLIRCGHTPVGVTSPKNSTEPTRSDQAWGL